MVDSQRNKSGLAVRVETYPHFEERLNHLLDLMKNRSGTLIKAESIVTGRTERQNAQPLSVRYFRCSTKKNA